MASEFDPNTASVRELAANIPPNAYGITGNKSASGEVKARMDCHGPLLARVHDIKSPGTSRAPATGIFAHNRLEQAVQHHIDTGKIIEQGLFRELIDKSLEDTRFGYDIDDISEDEIEDTIAGAREYSNALYPILETINDPQFTEEKLYFDLETEQRNHEMVAIIDVVDVDPEPGPNGKHSLRVRDLKTSSTFQPDRYLKSPQMAIYTAAMTANNMPTQLARVDHLRRLKTGVKYNEISMIRGPKHWEHLGVLLDQMHDVIEQNKFTFNPSSWLCNERCPLWDRCEFRYPDSIAQSA